MTAKLISGKVTVDQGPVAIAVKQDNRKAPPRECSALPPGERKWIVFAPKGPYRPVWVAAKSWFEARALGESQLGLQRGEVDARLEE